MPTPASCVLARYYDLRKATSGPLRHPFLDPSHPHRWPGGTNLPTARQVAERLQVSQKTIYRLAEQGRLPSIRAGGSLRFPQDQIEAWLRHGRWPRQARLRQS